MKSNDDIILEYIILSTARNVMSRNVKEFTTEKNKLVNSKISDQLHEVKKTMESRKIKYHTDHTKNSSDFFYFMYENGWRRSRSIDKQTIKKAAAELILQLQRGI